MNEKGEMDLEKKRWFIRVPRKRGEKGQKDTYDRRITLERSSHLSYLLLFTYLLIVISLSLQLLTKRKFYGILISYYSF